MLNIPLWGETEGLASYLSVACVYFGLFRHFKSLSRIAWMRQYS